MLTNFRTITLFGLSLGFMLTSEIAQASDKTDIDTIAKVVFAEACGETKAGKLAVASVIVNRSYSVGYPHTVHGVCFQRNAFESVTKQSNLWRAVGGGRLSDKQKEKYEECKIAAKQAVEGNGVKDIIAFKTIECQGGARYFSKLHQKAVIGNHVFYTN